MIRFAHPKLQKMASGLYCLELTEAGSWESFPLFAEKYAAQIGATIVKKIEGPDIHLWEIEYEGSILNFVYDDFPNGVSVEPKERGGENAIEKLYELAKVQSDQNGL
ncbi:DUF3630 family protein [Methylomonas sp. MED-D]|uniref:DUF3630 family protein n=1 Tax=unclassified Methylomonas TaxID=2608980 RepID=UPI002479B8DF|nr:MULTISPECIES: DUF3630 family protein [unclassified Methylomonas]MDT4329058.1 DUF3630 family protein [Methylomonas sp. MV1]WGS87729.1 DUF3630 family protein [Methylomonas sp. UP202]